MAKAKYQPLTAPDPNQKGWPGGIKYIIGNKTGDVNKIPEELKIVTFHELALK